MISSKQIDFIKNVIKLQGNKYNFDKTNYINQRTKIIVTCVKHNHDFEIFPSVLLGSKKKFNRSFSVGSCPICQKEYFDNIKKETINKFKIVHNNKYEYDINNYINSHIPFNAICKKHGNFKIIGKSHVLGHGKCPLCQDKLKNKIIKYYGINNEIIFNANETITFICKIHNTTETINKKYFSKINLKDKKYVCKTCYMNALTDKCSIGEMKINEFLIKNNIRFEREKTFYNCKNINLLRFDFYIPDHRLIIEFDGEQHYKPNKYFGMKSFKSTIINDKIKNKYCIKNNINLVRLDYNDLYSNNIENKLNEIFF